MTTEPACPPRPSDASGAAFLWAFQRLIDQITRVRFLVGRAAMVLSSSNELRAPRKGFATPRCVVITKPRPAAPSHRGQLDRLGGSPDGGEDGDWGLPDGDDV